MADEPQMAGRQLFDVSEKQARCLLVGLIVASTIGFSWLAFLKYAAFASQSIDTAIYSYAFNQARPGIFYPFLAGEGSLLGQHVGLLILFWMPIYWAVPSVPGLLLFQSLAISLAAWPVYLLAFDKTRSRWTALVAAAGFLLYPPIVSQHVNQIHDDQFGLALLLFAFYFFEAGNFKKFAVTLSLCLLAKETVALPVACFSLYAVIRRRQSKWMAFPVVVSFAYVLFAWKVLAPMFGGTDSLVYLRMGYFGEYGDTPRGVLRYVLTHPAGTIEAMLAPDRLAYLFRLLLPVLLFLPLGSAAWLMALPGLMMNLFGSNSTLRDVRWHYSLFPAALLYASFVSAIPYWSRKLARFFPGTDFARVLCFAVLLGGLASYNFWLVPAQYRRDRAYQARREVIALIPRQASVLCSDNMLAHFSRHRSLQSLFGLRFYRRDPNEVFDYDYIVFDKNFAITMGVQSLKQLFELISQMPEYRLIFSRDGILAYQRVGAPARTLNW